MFCRSLFILFLLAIVLSVLLLAIVLSVLLLAIVLSVLLLAIVLSVLRFTDSDCPFWYLQTALPKSNRNIVETKPKSIPLTHRSMHHRYTCKYVVYLYEGLIFIERFMVNFWFHRSWIDKLFHEYGNERYFSLGITISLCITY
jgi:hypothetical protein